MNKIGYAYELMIKLTVSKSSLTFGKLSILGVLAGLFIALGAATSSTAAFGFSNAGLMRLITGAVFPIGLILIVFIGGELFTGNCLLSLGQFENRITFKSIVKNLIIVWFTNFIGSLIVVYLIWQSNNWAIGNGMLGVHTVKIAAAKCMLNPMQCITSGILCNIFVCMAIVAALAAKNAGGKIFVIWFPIFAFALGGFEHVVANMYYLPAGYIAANFAGFADAAKNVGIDCSIITFPAMLKNLVYVTIGNMLGGIFFSSVPIFMIRHK